MPFVYGMRGRRGGACRAVAANLKWPIHLVGIEFSEETRNAVVYTAEQVPEKESMNKGYEVDWSKVHKRIQEIYSAVDNLEKAFPGRKFTPDGHLVGSIGEVLAAYIFDLDLLPPSTPGHDAVTRDSKKRKVEIKLTGGKSIAMRQQHEHLLVLQLSKGSRARVVYNGPGSTVWNSAGKRQKNGQCSISVKKLLYLYDDVPSDKRLPEKNEIPI